MREGTHIAAFITGHSVRGCTGLSAEQLTFQNRSAVPAERWLKHNFPFHETAPFPTSIGLLRASFNNFRHFVDSRRQDFSSSHCAQLTKLFSSHEAVILLAGSCGVQLLHGLDLPVDILRRIHVFAYGPVSLARPQTASLCVVQGKNDFISRCFFREADHRINCSHMGYLLARETLDLFNSFYRRVLNDAGLAP